MNHVKLLDCTLRDGAYLVDKTFGDIAIHGIINGLVETGIEFIEIGFFQDDGFGEGKTVFRNSKDASRFVPKEKKGCEFTVLADFSRFSIENLDDKNSDSIDAIRECFFKNERFEALKVCRTIKQKGYKLFVQPVDILGYSDSELIQFIELVNEIEPYCFSIVDTFGSMYQEDLHRVFELINHNLISSCKIGFHSHNNMQLSSALSQEFIRMTVGRREICIDGTISGMGRGAGNTPTELVVQYINTYMNGKYNIDSLLDVIDSYMDNIRSKCSWGYSTPFFIAGSYSAHVNNIAYLSKKNSIRSKDIRYILNKIGSESRKRYDYNLLESTYLELMNSEVNDSESLYELKKILHDKNILVLIPGSSIEKKKNLILEYIKLNKPLVVSVSFIPYDIPVDFVYINNARRYKYWKDEEKFMSSKKILTSNISNIKEDENTYIISFGKLVKCGKWNHLDNSAIMLLRLLDILVPKSIIFAGFDGYSYKSEASSNYVSKELELSSTAESPVEHNEEIEDMLKDFNLTRINKDIDVSFLTKSRFSICFGK